MLLSPVLVILIVAVAFGLGALILLPFILWNLREKARARHFHEVFARINSRTRQMYTEAEYPTVAFRAPSLLRVI